MKPTPIHLVVARLKRLSLPSQAEVIARLNYDPDTGILRWRTSPMPAMVGKIAGSKPDVNGYSRIYFAGHGTFAAHRLAWIHANGCFDPVGFSVDHKNGARHDNRLSNLRLVTPTQNSINTKTRRNTVTGVKGVGVISSGRFAARLKIAGKTKTVGYFDTIEQAAAARVAAAREHFGEFRRETLE